MTRFTRLDRFTLPPQAREALLARMDASDCLLDACDGMLGESRLERSLPDGRIELVTLRHWSDDAAVQNAVRIMAKAAAAEGFDRAAFLAQQGIEADFGLFQDL
ncbi:MAG: hypothetical protein ACOH2M_02085 [Cypionkella sp.]